MLRKPCFPNTLLAHSRRVLARPSSSPARAPLPIPVRVAPIHDHPQPARQPVARPRHARVRHHLYASLCSEAERLHPRWRVSHIVGTQYRALVFKHVFAQLAQPDAPRESLFRAYIKDIVPSSAVCIGMAEPTARALFALLSPHVGISFDDRWSMVAQLVALMRDRNCQLSLPLLAKLYTETVKTRYASALVLLQRETLRSILHFLPHDTTPSDTPTGYVTPLRRAASTLYTHLIEMAHSRHQHARVIYMYHHLQPLGLPDPPSWHIIHSLFQDFQTRPITPSAIVSLIESVRFVLESIPPPLSPRYLNLLVRGFGSTLYAATKHRISVPPEIVPAMTATRKSGGADPILELAWADVLLSLREYIGTWNNPYEGVAGVGSMSELWSYQHVIGRLRHEHWGTDKMGAFYDPLSSSSSPAAAYPSTSAPTTGGIATPPSSFDKFRRPALTTSLNAHRLQILIRASLLDSSYSSALAYLAAQRAVTVAFIRQAPSVCAAFPNRAEKVLAMTEDLKKRLEGSFVRIASHAMKNKEIQLMNDVFEVASPRPISNARTASTLSSLLESEDPRHYPCARKSAALDTLRAVTPPHSGRPLPLPPAHVPAPTSALAAQSMPSLMFYPRVWKRVIHAMKAWSAPWSGPDGIERLLTILLRTLDTLPPPPKPGVGARPALHDQGRPMHAVAGAGAGTTSGPASALKELSAHTFRRTYVLKYFATSAINEAQAIIIGSGEGAGADALQKAEGSAGPTPVSTAGGEGQRAKVKVKVKAMTNVYAPGPGSDGQGQQSISEPERGEEWQAPLRMLMRTLDAVRARLPPGFWGRFCTEMEEERRQRRIPLRKAPEIRRFLEEWGCGGPGRSGAIEEGEQGSN
ncbi:hypothetical protein BOTBODRAFT_28574 [Botryobasidium botryosum FD-172 SS1]|uniref:Uncharacterized protein n=1 Tax=Botryobasidium botryosum (strain FD-172 SS1) TaxID=930990 RepID=A0A067N5M2_BOTB1|nr:hypothetical protein BOTBODRAFT_28574 [Botryobasidium botryosum FD-172 SS1]